MPHDIWVDGCFDFLVVTSAEQSWFTLNQVYITLYRVRKPPKKGHVTSIKLYVCAQHLFGCRHEVFAMVATNMSMLCFAQNVGEFMAYDLVQLV